METGTSILWIYGKALPVTGFLAFNHSNTISDMLGSHSWGDYMDRLRTFQWPLLAGFVIVLILIAFKTDNSDHHDHHDDNQGGHRRLQPVRVKSQYRN